MVSTIPSKNELMPHTVQTRTYLRDECIVFRKTKERFGGLSNMASGFPLEVNGVSVWTAEALYQACRFPYLPRVQEMIIGQRSPMTAKMKSKPFRKDSRPDWLNIRVKVMRWCLRVKLAENWEKFGELLLVTGDRQIVEESPKDEFWGAKPENNETLVGANVLGRLLMELREELRGPKRESLQRVGLPEIPDFLFLGEPIRTVGGRLLTSEAAPSTTLEAEVVPHFPGSAEVTNGIDATGLERQLLSASTETKESDMVKPGIPKECKRLAEVDFPVAEVSKHSAREKSIRRGHPSTLHLWWARRPLAACRAMLMALLLPDPCDVNCPAEFREEARQLLKPMPNCGSTRTNKELRDALIGFIADFANWDNAAKPAYLECSRGLVKAAHGEELPLVVDSFAGGGSIPLESLRVGCDTFASDLNPVACLVLRTMLESIPRYGSELARLFRAESTRLEQDAETEIARYYPKEPNGQYPFGYVWARTARCEAPSCGLEIPLLTSLWLSKRRNAKVGLRYTVRESAPGSYKVDFELFRPTTESEVGSGTVRHVRAVCPRCGVTLPNARIRAQLCTRRGGASDARLIAVVVRGLDGHLSYRLPNEHDYSAYIEAAETLRRQNADATAAIPNEPLPQRFRAKSSFDVIPYGASTWADLFNARQLLSLTTITRLIRSDHSRTDCENAVSELLALSVSKLAERFSAGVSWITQTQAIRGTFSRQAIPMIWDYVEIVPFGDSTQYREVAEAMARAIETEAAAGLRPAMVREANAAETLLPDQSAATWFTDPPYYDNIAYADLSDFFYVWLKRALPGHPLLRDPYDPSNTLTPKVKECIQSEERIVDGRPMDRDHFERCVREAFLEGNRICSPNGIASVVFAHKKTEGWEALLAALHSGRWTITASWPIVTERAARLVARQQAALAASVHLICRPRAVDAGVGDWREVLRELPGRVGDWMERLQDEGIRGADLVFSCIGPALELFSKHDKVETAEGREVELPEFLEKVWEVVGRSALQQILGTAEARARNSTAGALEEDARLTALFLWTLQSTNGQVESQKSKVESEEETSEDEEEEDGAGKPKKGYVLIYDVARRFAQPLGIHLENWEGRIIETKKGAVRLIPVTERAEELFGQAGTEAVARAIERTHGESPQFTLFPDEERAPETPIKTRKASRGPKADTAGAGQKPSVTPREATTLDRVHAAMLLQAGGQATALRAMLEAETQRSPDFLRLANALSALYPKDSEEKRLLDAMLLTVARH